MGLFDTDPIITSNGGAADPTTPAPSSPTDPCVQPPNGLPRYDRVVLDALHGDGYITRATYKAVIAGTKSIEDLEITSLQLSRLRCEGGGVADCYDPHFDPEFPPLLTPAAAAGVTVQWTVQHKPTDKAHRLSITTPAGLAQAPGPVAHIDFGTQYVDDDGLVVAPIVNVSGVGGTQVFRAANITSTGYDLLSDNGIGPAMIANVQVDVQPARR